MKRVFTFRRARMGLAAALCALPCVLQCGPQSGTESGNPINPPAPPGIDPAPPLASTQPSASSTPSTGVTVPPKPSDTTPPDPTDGPPPDPTGPRPPQTTPPSTTPPPNTGPPPSTAPPLVTSGSPSVTAPMGTSSQNPTFPSAGNSGPGPSIPPDGSSGAVDPPDPCDASSCADLASQAAAAVSQGLVQPVPFERATCLDIDAGAAICECARLGTRLQIGSETGTCAIVGRHGQCLYSSDEFASCTMDADCSAVCEEISVRERDDALPLVDVTVRASACSVDEQCRYVLQADTQCWSGPPTAVADCEQSDAELLAGP